MRAKLCDSFSGQDRTPLQNFELPLNVLLTQQEKIRSVLRRYGSLAYAVFFAATVVIARDILSLLPVGGNFNNCGFFTKDELVKSIAEESCVDCSIKDNLQMVCEIVDELCQIGFLQVNANGELYSDTIREACDWPTLEELDKAENKDTSEDMQTELF